ncbi:MAG: tail fiber domain-containing protein, partial [Myxococcales bacterium]|nr:tail fiber domain-containing protein [Myxococcales bacterium]
AVLVNASGTLGTTTSSARFKRDVADMGSASDVLMKLRPVVFHYTEEAVGKEASGELQYGLIAEEVADVAPELVAPGADGSPYSVKYHVLPALLLNELQKSELRNDEQQRTIEELLARLAALEALQGSAGRE